MSDTTKGQRFHGGCHCGNIRFWFDWSAQVENIPVRACGCSFCTKHGAVWTSHPEGQFQLQIIDPFQAKRYQFGTKTADIHIYTNCGIPPITTCTIDGRDYAVLNSNTFENVDRSMFDQSPTNFDDESVGDRQARRQRNWTPRAADE